MNRPSKWKSSLLLHSCVPTRHPSSSLLDDQALWGFLSPIDNSMAVRCRGETIPITPTLTPSQYTDNTATLARTPTPSLKLSRVSQSLDPFPTTPSAMRPLLNSCIIVLTVTASMIVNVRFFSVFLPKSLTSPFQVANSTSMYIALPTVQKEMNLEPPQLQWVVAAYPFSSVSISQFIVRKTTQQFQTFILPTWTLLIIDKNSRVVSSSYVVDSVTSMGERRCS